MSIVSNAAIVTGEGSDPGVNSETGFRAAQGGIVAISNGQISIDSTSVDVEGEYRFGIYAQSDGAIDITSGELNYEASDSAGIFVLGGSGDVTVDSGTLIASGTSGSGIVARSGSGNITINAGTTQANGEGVTGQYTADAVVGIAGTGDVTITSADASSAGFGGSAVVGIGGIASLDDAMQFFVAGASAVQIGTANFYDPTAPIRILDALPQALNEAGVRRLVDLVGTVQTE